MPASLLDCPYQSCAQTVTMTVAIKLDEILVLAPEATTRSNGRPEKTIHGIAALTKAGPGDLAFLGNKRYRADVAGCRASIILLPLDYTEPPGPDQIHIHVDNPSFVLALVCREIERRMRPQPTPGIHPMACIDRDAVVDDSATVGPFCHIGPGARIGAGTVLEAQVHVGREVVIGRDCHLMPQVCLGDYTELGDRVKLHFGVVVGSDGFGYETIKGEHHKIPQIGRVVIGNDVEIGAHTTIDRARFDATRIGRGTKIDNLVQIAHNVIIGQGCLIVAQAGISGSTVLEDYVIVGGQAGLTGHIHIGREAKIGAQAGVNHDLEPASFVRDSPAFPYMHAQKVHILKKRLPELFKRVATLEEMMELTQSTPNPESDT